MKINGITVGTPTPRSNFNQTDEKKADYIIGRENIAKHIGFTTFMSYNGGFPDEGELDVTDYITYKPKFNESWDSAFKPMFFTDSSLGSGTGDGLTFHNYYTIWDWHSLSFSIYFHSYTVSGNRKIIRLDYRYANENATAPQSITAYLSTENPIGDIESALDSIIAIQESLIGGGTV